VLVEEFVYEGADRRFVRIRLEFLVAPAVPEGRGPADRFPELRANRHRGLYALGNLLALPLRHGGDHREEEAPRGRTRVDRLLKRDQIGTAGAEGFGEVEELLRVARQAREFREDETGDHSGADVREHPLGLRVPHDGFATDRFEPVDFSNMPAFDLRIRAGSLFMVLGAFASHLILG
jgi:hypothetical protein